MVMGKLSIFSLVNAYRYYLIGQTRRLNQVVKVMVLSESGDELENTIPAPILEGPITKQNDEEGIG